MTAAAGPDGQLCNRETDYEILRSQLVHCGSPASKCQTRTCSLLLLDARFNDPHVRLRFHC